MTFKLYNFTYSIAYTPDDLMAQIQILNLFYTKILFKKFSSIDNSFFNTDKPELMFPHGLVFPLVCKVYD